MIARPARPAVADGLGAVRRRRLRASRPSCPKAEINTLIPALKDQGATDIFELALSKIVH